METDGPLIEDLQTLKKTVKEEACQVKPCEDSKVLQFMSSFLKVIGNHKLGLYLQPSKHLFYSNTLHQVCYFQV